MPDTFQALLTDIKKTQDIVKNTVDTENYPGKEFCDLLASLPFWCGDNELHIKDPDYKHTARCCTTHIIGLPRHAATNEEMPLTPFQVDLAIKVIDGRLGYGDAIAQMRRPLLMHLLKGRQMGFTEIVLRLIIHLSFTRYAGSNVGIIAATNGSLAKKDLRRLARLLKSIPVVVQQWIKGTKEGVCLILVNGTTIWAYPASEEAMTGDTNYKCVFMDEAAKWRTIDDTPVFNSILPIVRTNGADLFLVSTPKGPVKMFYQIHEDPQDFVMFEYDIWHTEGNLYTHDEIMTLLASSKEDPEQEYLCKYKIGKDQIFGPVKDEDQQGPLEWLVLEDNNDVEQEEDYDEDVDKDGIHWHEN